MTTDTDDLERLAQELNAAAIAYAGSSTGTLLSRACTAIIAIAKLRERNKQLKHACAHVNDRVTQTLGKALGYPWYKDDQKNFPDATEATGVYVGEHTAESLADETAKRIAKLRERLEACRELARDDHREHLRLRDAETARADAAEAEKADWHRHWRNVFAEKRAAEAESAALREALSEAVEVVRQCDQMATCPAAEYVPALSDIYTMTGAFLAKHAPVQGGE